jgi:ribonuclease E
MANKMLIDASHPEETRVVVLRGNRVEEFDFESANKKQLRGNIYLAKVTRVEPSLQAAFVDYGGNRHGFLAFSEIHPDYYQIPVVDRQALLEEEALAQRDDDQDEARHARRSRRHRRNERVGEVAEKRRVDDERVVDSEDAELDDDAATTRASAGEDAAAGGEADETWRESPAEDRSHLATQDIDDDSEAANTTISESAETAGAEEAPHDEDHAAKRAIAASAPDVDEAGEAVAAAQEPDTESDAGATPHRLATDPEGFAVVDDEGDLVGEAEASEEAESRFRPEPASDEDDEGDDEADQVEQLGGDAMEEVPVRPHRPRRQYKIQEVIKRRQVLLVQVVKEERGNKGAALTTYLSLAGRYSVLMPNTARGGGISRKITDASDRQRLKSIAQELEVPEGMGVILRTAGAARTKAEVKRDFEYLLRMWETVREMTLQSTAPALVYEEGSLVKRAIRDLYNKDIDEVTVSGEIGYRDAKEFMRMLIPSHAKNVHLYREPQPIFAKFSVEAQLDAMFSNQVTLKSGGYLVINQTEALVAIDVNSGRATREHNIEDTALRTNLEAADEIARQLRLRDLAGLIVVDFIDMEEPRNNRAVERRLKEALRNDRARIQIGRISHFGLLEMSRQRMRTGVLEGSTIMCPHCAGAGTVRSTSSIALHVLRLLEDALIKSASHNITVRTRTEVALYILNQKRANLRDLERRFGVSITINADDSLTGIAYHAVERGEPATGFVEVPPLEPPRLAEQAEEAEETFAEDGLPEGEADAEAPGEEGDGEGDAGRKRRRRRRRRGRDRELSGIAPNAPQPSDDGLAFLADIGAPAAEAAATDGHEGRLGETEDRGADAAEEHESRPDGRRRRPRRRGRGGGDIRHRDDNSDWSQTRLGAAPLPDEPVLAEELPFGETPQPAEPASITAVAADAVAPAQEAEPTASARDAEPERHVEPAVATPDITETPEATVRSSSPPADPSRPKRTGWWQRAKATLGG